jgi:hypothetical protein
LKTFHFLGVSNLGFPNSGSKLIFTLFKQTWNFTNLYFKRPNMGYSMNQRYYFSGSRAEIFKNFCWYFGPNDDTKRTFWNKLTFNNNLTDNLMDNLTIISNVNNCKIDVQKWKLFSRFPYLILSLRKILHTTWFGYRTAS